MGRGIDGGQYEWRSVASWKGGGEAKRRWAEGTMVGLGDRGLKVSQVGQKEAGVGLGL